MDDWLSRFKLIFYMLITDGRTDLHGYLLSCYRDLKTQRLTKGHFIGTPCRLNDSNYDKPQDQIKRRNGLQKRLDLDFDPLDPYFKLKLEN